MIKKISITLSPTFFSEVRKSSHPQRIGIWAQGGVSKGHLHVDVARRSQKETNSQIFVAASVARNYFCSFAFDKLRAALLSFVSKPKVDQQRRSASCKSRTRSVLALVCHPALWKNVTEVMK